MSKETLRDGAIRRALRSSGRKSSEPCPDEDVLASYLELRLGEAEKNRVETHASQCTSCREVLGLALQLVDADAAPEAGEPETSGKRLLFRFSLPISALSMVVLLILAGFLFVRVLGESTRRLPPRTAELHAPPRAESLSSAREPDGPEAKPEMIAGPKARTSSAGALKVAGDSGREKKPAPAAPVPPSAVPQTVKALGAAAAIETKGRTEPAEPLAAGSINAVAERDLNRSQAFAPPVPVNREEAAKSSLTAVPYGGLQRVRAAAQIAGETMAHRAVESLARELSSAQAAPPQKELGNRIFYLNSGYWIDVRCVTQPNAVYREIKTGSEEYLQMVKILPELKDLHPAIVYWDQENRVIN